MLSCAEICKSLSSFEGEQDYEIKNYNPLFEQSADFSKKYLQLVEDKIKENGWIDPNLQPEQFKKEKEIEKEKDIEKKDKESESNDVSLSPNTDLNLNYKEHQTYDLPQKLLNVINLSRRKELYYYGMKGPDSFLASVLLAAEPNYWLQHRKKKKEYADQIKTTFCIQKYDILRGLPKTSVGNDYINVIYSNDFPEHIDSDKSKELQFLIGMNFKINILVIDLKTQKGHFTTDWNEDNQSIIILFDTHYQTYLPVLSNNIAYFDTTEIKELEAGFNILYPTKTELDPSSKSISKNKNIITKAEQIDIKRIKVEHIQNVNKYQLKDLQDMVEILGLQTEYQKVSTDGKITKTLRKTKQQLYDDLIEKITSLGN
jgi:hypothetical protein